MIGRIRIYNKMGLRLSRGNWTRLIQACTVIGDLDSFSDCLFYFCSICEFDKLMLDSLEDVKNVTSQRSRVDFREREKGGVSV